MLDIDAGSAEPLRAAARREMVRAARAIWVAQSPPDHPPVPRGLVHDHAPPVLRLAGRAICFRRSPTTPTASAFCSTTSRSPSAICASPCRPADQSNADRLLVLANLDWPADTLVQVSLWTSPDVEERIARMEGLRMNTAIPCCASPARRTAAFLRRWQRRAPTPATDIRLRELHVLVTVKLALAASAAERARTARGRGAAGHRPTGTRHRGTAPAAPHRGSLRARHDDPAQLGPTTRAGAIASFPSATPSG